MGSIFGGLNIGLSAIAAQQRALDVTSHNVSNVNTPGYCRQTINLAATTPDYIGRSGNGGYLQQGTGVDIGEIKELRDEFLDRKLKRENSGLGYWEARESSTSELEAIFNDSSEEGLQTVMNNFWDSWDQLSKPTGGLTARALVKENAISFIEDVQYLDNTLDNYKKNKDSEITEDVGKINDMAKRIAELNMEIKKDESYGIVASDYRDERDNLINELSKMVKIQLVNSSTVNIAVEGKMLVEDTKYNEIEAVPDAGNNGYVKLRWKDTKADVQLNGGSMKSLFESRDDLVEGYRAKLNELVKGVAAEVNKIHITGTGIKDSVHRNFFVNCQDLSGNNIDISNIELNPDLDDFDNIASGMSPENVEDNTVALQISQLRLKDIFGDDTYDTTNPKYNSDEFYRNIITDLGNKGSEAETALSSQNTLVEQIQYKQQTASAVSLDEEMSNLIKYEHSYNAAARIVNTMDEMLDVIINKTGMIGR